VHAEDIHNKQRDMLQIYEFDENSGDEYPRAPACSMTTLVSRSPDALIRELPIEVLPQTPRRVTAIPVGPLEPQASMGLAR
jgi:hypothetical protein